MTKRAEILFEDMQGQVQAILEFVADIPAMKADIAQLKEDMADVKSRLTVHEVILREHSREIAKINAKLS